MNKSKSLIFEANIPSYVYILMERFPNEFKQYNELLIKTADIKIIENLTKFNIADQKACISVLKANAKPDKSKKISKILGTLAVTDK